MEVDFPIQLIVCQIQTWEANLLIISYSSQASKQTQIQNESTTCQKAKQGGLISANPILFRFTPWTKNLLQQIQSNYIFNKKNHFPFHFVLENWFKVQLTTFRNQYLSAGVVSGIATVSIGEVFRQIKWRKWKIGPFGHCVTYNISLRCESHSGQLNL